MTESSNKPSIRFTGFTDPWEQRKLGNIASFTKGNGYSKADIRESGVPLFLYGRMYTQYEAAVESVDTFAMPKQGTLYSTGKELVVPASGESAEDIARASAICRAGIALGGDLNVIYPQEMAKPLFLAYGLSHGSNRKLLAQRAQGKTVVHIHASDLEGLSVELPSIPEQQTIGRFFSRLDSLITLHQRKYDKLVVLKKSMLEQMFPQEGESVPKIRFAGFTDPWEQRKLGELISEIAAGKSVNSTDDPVSTADIAVLKTSCVSNGYFESAECKRVIESEKDLVKCSVVAGSIIVSRMNTPDRVGACGLSEASHDNLFLPDRLWRLSLRSDYDPYCVYVVLASESSQTRIKGMASGTSGSMHNVPKQSFLGMNLLLPANCTEQQAIGSFFSRLDSLITLHQRKLELLQNIKKSLLEQMFV
ncbi:restriction endonuclease subunit S [Bifidobacterium callitrichidarum]|uniref:Restriction endonuclease subunit S n=1 Tax=Bifidobacterium callitrichidarum TaxID=2052941 RepID=A0A2U2N8C8_9BIFI|nr:restriction endonuclease subunit S [Bifidobacterium callitrichidarum]PWG65348.1 restriction endonuclease subunit S [Bifidobacterium callitrichidarum]